MKIAKELDYNLQAYQERVGLVNFLDKEGYLSQCSSSELDKVANYLLYAEDVEAQVELKEGSKKKVSYETLIESTLGENLVQKREESSIYRTVRPTIDREKDANIPGIQGLWEAISIIEEKYKYCKNVLDGSIELDIERKLLPTYQNKYFYREWMIDLRREQFILKDGYKPIICNQPVFRNFARKPDVIGMKIGKFTLCDNDLMIDFGNWQHIYALLKNYSGMKGTIENNISNDWWEVYDFLDMLIERVRWSPEHKHILIRKIDKIPNETIVSELEAMGGKTYSVNYVSTIWKQHISKKIVKQAILYSKEKLNKPDGTMATMSNWRICPTCGRMLYADDINFGKYMTGEWREVCKDCTYQEKIEKELRRLKREEARNAKQKNSNKRR